MDSLHSLVLENKRQRERQEKNEAGKRRLQEIQMGGNTQWSGNIKDLSNSFNTIKSDAWCPGVYFLSLTSNKKERLNYKIIKN